MNGKKQCHNCDEWYNVEATFYEHDDGEVCARCHNELEEAEADAEDGDIEIDIIARADALQRRAAHRTF